MSWLGRQYSRWPVKAVVLTVYFALLAVGIYGTSQMRVDADVNGATPQLKPLCSLPQELLHGPWRG